MSNVFATLTEQTVKALDNKKKSEAKAKAKPAQVKKKTAQPKTAKPVASAIKYRLITGRPSNKAYGLFEFTQAWLELSGMMSGKAFDKKSAQMIAGNSAIAHHIQQGRIAEKNGLLTLTAGGKAHFTERATLDTETVNAYKAIMQHGKPVAGLKVEKSHIGAM